MFKHKSQIITCDLFCSLFYTTEFVNAKKLSVISATKTYAGTNWLQLWDVT